METSNIQKESISKSSLWVCRQALLLREHYLLGFLKRAPQKHIEYEHEINEVRKAFDEVQAYYFSVANGHRPFEDKELA
jgi:hypothetical protein